MLHRTVPVEDVEREDGHGMPEPWAVKNSFIDLCSMTCNITVPCMSGFESPLPLRRHGSSRRLSVQRSPVLKLFGRHVGLGNADLPIHPSSV